MSAPLKPLKMNLQRQLNHFKALEYCEVHSHLVTEEDCELDLPNLKVLSVGWCHTDAEKLRITLNTPSLKAMKITTDWSCPHIRKANIRNFRFLFPSSLRHLEMIFHEADFKFENRFENLEVLIFPNTSSNLLDTPDGDLFAEDFFESLPSLKFIFSEWFSKDVLSILETGKRKFNLKDLKILTSKTVGSERFDYMNWRRYLEKQPPYWPGKFELVFDKLVSCQVPLDLFKEGYFQFIELMKVRQVDDQSLLVDLLREVQVAKLELEYDCNLGQSFIDQIVDSGIVLNKLILNECVWNRMNDFSVLTRLHILNFEVQIQQFRVEPALAMLRNPLCVTFYFSFYKGFCREKMEDRDGELRQDLNIWPRFSHYICRDGNDFKCNTCGYTSSDDPNSFEDPVAATAQHADYGPESLDRVFLKCANQPSVRIEAEDNN